MKENKESANLLTPTGDGFLSVDNKKQEALTELEHSTFTALETYSNVHRGSGHFSMVSTILYEKARDIVLEYLGLNKKNHIVIFCSPLRAEDLTEQLGQKSYRILSSQNIGLPLGVRALVINKKDLPGGIPSVAGGGTTRLVSPKWIVWADAPAKYEAGTPAIINIIAFARALQLIRRLAINDLKEADGTDSSVSEILYNDEFESFSGNRLLDELRKTRIGSDVLVPTDEGPKPYINLDNGASNPTFNSIYNAFIRTCRQPVAVQQELIQEVRSVCAETLGAPLIDYDVIFTSNTTEAINLVAENLYSKPDPEVEPVIVNTILEHNSNDLPWRIANRFSLVRLPVDSEGFIDLDKLEKLMCDYNEKILYGKKRIRLVAVSGASNVLGVFNDLSEISRITHKYGAHILVDAAQLVAHRKSAVEKCGIDYFAFSAHKAYAPFGSGALLLRKGLLNFNPERLSQIQRTGEENSAGIAALGKALILLQRIGLDLILEKEQALTAKTVNGLSRIEGLTLYGIKDTESPVFCNKGGVIVFTLKNCFSDVIAKELAKGGGIGIRNGCHCAHILIKHLVNVGPFLERFQRIIAVLFPQIKFPGVARLSIGICNTEKDIDNLIVMVDKIARQKKIPSHIRTEQQMLDFSREVSGKVYS